MRVTGKQESKLQRLWKRKHDVVLAILRNRKDKRRIFLRLRNTSLRINSTPNIEFRMWNRPLSFAEASTLGTSTLGTSSPGAQAGQASPA